MAADAAQRRRRFERLSNVREIVFGLQDGTLTTAGMLSGLSSALPQRSQVIIAALAATAAGALSMGAGAYLGAKAESEVIEGELKRAHADVAEEPYLMQETLLEELGKEGLSREAGYRVVKLLSAAPEALRSTIEAKVYGLGGALKANPLLDGLVMGAAFLFGALVPLLPFFLVPSIDTGLIAAEGAAGLALFAVGYFSGWLAERGPWLSGARFLSIAVGAAMGGYLAGLVIAKLGGLSTPPVTP